MKNIFKTLKTFFGFASEESEPDYIHFLRSAKIPVRLETSETKVRITDFYAGRFRIDFIICYDTEYYNVIPETYDEPASFDVNFIFLDIEGIYITEGNEILELTDSEIEKIKLILCDLIKIK